MFSDTKVKFLVRLEEVEKLSVALVRGEMRSEDGSEAKGGHHTQQ